MFRFFLPLFIHETEEHAQNFLLTRLSLSLARNTAHKQKLYAKAIVFRLITSSSLHFSNIFYESRATLIEVIGLDDNVLDKGKLAGLETVFSSFKSILVLDDKFPL